MKYGYLLVILLLVGCSLEKEYVPKGEEVFQNFPESLESIESAYRKDKVLFLNQFVEKGDITTQFQCSQFFDNVDIESVVLEKDAYVVTGKDGCSYEVTVSVEGNKLQDFCVVEKKNKKEE